MKKTLSLITGICLTIGFSSCQNMGPNTQQGAATGAAIGGLGGAIIGHQSGRTTEGALLGAAAGGVAGAAYGSHKDEEEGR